MAILAKYIKKVYKRLLQDVQQGKMSESSTKLTGIAKLSVNQGIILRGERLLMPTKLRPDVAHEGCPGGDSMLRKLRKDVWRPGMHQDMNKFTSSCWACASATPTISTPPMTMRSTTERVWSEVQADFKGPVGGRYYFHVVID